MMALEDMVGGGVMPASELVVVVLASVGESTEYDVVVV